MKETLRKRLPVDKIKRLIWCDAASGKLIWNYRTPSDFDGHAYGDINTACKRFNTRHGGNEAFTAKTVSGYKHGRLFGLTYYAHYVVWAIYHGEWADDMVDHIDGNKLNNSIFNLRQVDNRTNAKNARRMVDNSSGHPGIYWYKTRSKWHASIRGDNGDSVFLGYFVNLDDAIIARMDAEMKYGYHTNHGRSE